jgi:hypothetical protein
VTPFSLFLSLACYNPGEIFDSVRSLKDDIEDDSDADTDSDADSDADSDSDSDSDTDSDSDSPTTPPETLEIIDHSVTYDPFAEPAAVEWVIEVTGDPLPSDIKIKLVETGDPNVDCFVECGVWAEEHHGFSQIEDDVYHVVLLSINDPDMVDDGYSSLFDSSSLEGVSYLFTVGNPDGQDLCASGGHNPAYFDDVCP